MFYFYNIFLFNFKKIINMKTNNNINNLFNSPNIKETFINNNGKNNSNTNNIESFKVYVRIRPFLPKDLIINKNTNTLNNQNLPKNLSSPKNSLKNSFSEKMLKVEKNILYLEDVKTHKNNKIFVFDNIFNESTNNEEVFNESIKAMIDKILLGYNSTALAYGITGTGKTYTIFGDLSNNFKEEGIIFKACDYLFEKIEMNKNENNNSNINYYIKISYIEIYNEIVKDLISENSPSLIIVEDPQKGVICPNAKEIIINDSIELKKIINESNKRRTMANTNQNQFSSRSHAILQMAFEKRVKKSEDNYEIFFSKFLVVDLAGSERGMERGKRREEGVNINKSLFTLGSCLNILSEKSNMGKFVPYRDSKLTRLLKDSLGGNILTVMLACISPCSSTYDETLNTLNYAFKAKKITKKIMKNIKEIDISNFQYKEIIDTLKNEIMQLKKIIKNQEIKLKGKEIYDKEESKSNYEKEIYEKKLFNKNNLTKIELYENFDSSNSLDIRSGKNILENNVFNTSNSEREIYFKEKELKDNTNLNKINNNEDEIDVAIYNKYIDELINNELNINTLNEQIKNIQKDKNILESYLIKGNIKNESIINKYNSIKLIYDKYIEIINEKLVENIEQNMIYNFNIKEITELNKTNIDKIKELEQIKLENSDKNEKISEEINYTNKNILENNTQKEQIYESIKRNNEQKDDLKKALLTLLENKTDSLNNYIHVLKEKDKLFKITKQYEKEIENYVKLQKQKDGDMLKISRKIEILRAKLKEKDKKISELKKKGSKSKLELNNIKLFNNEKNKNNFGTISSEPKIVKSPPGKMNKCRMIAFKSENSRNNDREMAKSTINKEYKMMKNTQKISEKKNKEDKNCKNILNNNKKKLTILQNNNNKGHKKFINVNINKYKTENNIEQNTNSIINDISMQQKINELIIPKTTISLTDITSKSIGQIKPLHLKTSKNNKIKKTPTNNINNFKKYTFISQQSSKRNSSTNSNNIDTAIIRNIKKNVKSIKINFKENNDSELNLNQNLNSNKTSKSEKSEKSEKNEKSENNMINVKVFKAEKINIDLTNIDNSDNTLNEKINNVKLLKLKNDKLKKTIQNGVNKKSKFNKYTKNNNKEVNKKSKSNPKLSKEKNCKNNQPRKLTLQEARYENKLKYDKIPIKKGELNSAESFINDYQKMRSIDYMKRKTIKKINNEYNNTFLLNKEKDIEENVVQNFFIDIQKFKTNKLHNEIIDLNLKEKKQKGENENNTSIQNKNSIICNIDLDNNDNNSNKILIK